MTGYEESPDRDPYWRQSNSRGRALFLPSFLSTLVIALVPALALTAFLVFFR